MSRLPSLISVEHLTSSLRALGEAPAKGQPRRIDDLEQRLLRAVRRDLAGVPAPDGFPAGTLGGGGRGGPVVAVEEDEHGPEEKIPATSVEAAAIARADAKRVRDRHHELTVGAVRAVDEAVVAVQVAFAKLASIDDLLNTSAPAPKTCDHCSGKRGKNGNRPIYVRGTVGDRLERALALCKACYDFVGQTAKAGTRDGYLPSEEQITHHERTGRWRIRVIQRRAG